MTIAAVFGGIARAKDIFMPGLIRTAVNLRVARAKSVGPPAVSGAAFLIRVALVNALEENDFAQLDLICLVVVEIELELFSGTGLSHVINLLPATGELRIDFSDLNPVVT